MTDENKDLKSRLLNSEVDIDHNIQEAGKNSYSTKIKKRLLPFLLFVAYAHLLINL